MIPRLAKTHGFCPHQPEWGGRQRLTTLSGRQVCAPGRSIPSTGMFLWGAAPLHAPAQPRSPCGPCPVTGTQEGRGDSLMACQDRRHGPGRRSRRRRRTTSGMASCRRHTQSRPQEGGQAVNRRGEGEGHSVKGDSEGCKASYASEAPHGHPLFSSRCGYRWDWQPQAGKEPPPSLSPTPGPPRPPLSCG